MGKQQASYKIFSFYKGNVNPRVPRYQKAVFRYFGQTVHQVVREDFDHGDFLNHICRTETGVDYLIFFDIDCVPVSKAWIGWLLSDLQQPRTIAGAAQTANHLRNGENLYVGPFFFGISTAYLKALNYPDMRLTDTMDAGQNLTEVIQQEGGHVKYWWPTQIEKKEWTLYHPVHNSFGPGTTYDNLVYHAFYSRFDLADRFILKSKSLLKGSFYGYWWPWTKVP
ncbi:hypothetical protein [Paraflavitalea sp. CAU 1676]|uniref:hypothetical protein n=1 Tax=Paraflavitalea sp. CAU 1676 TaxID=3032598 RepID=UPI0023DB443B|nr:hypothetical protein [Paraflavitalea sp. CAU 1676]MDF2190582.1 hypothetical protein [Paraflavitalea sp. CAU 1676]